jgi:cytochrome c oxidase subunit I+III
MGATVFMLSVLQGQVVVVAVIMATYLAFREARGIMTTPTNVTMDIVARFIMFCALQGMVFTFLPRVFPGV